MRAMPAGAGRPVCMCPLTRRIAALRRKNAARPLPAGDVLTARGSRATLPRMKVLVAAVTAATLLAGCKSPGPGAAPPAHHRTSFKYGTGDGQTMATAVEIRTRSETEGS